MDLRKRHRPDLHRAPGRIILPVQSNPYFPQIDGRCRRSDPSVLGEIRIELPLGLLEPGRRHEKDEQKEYDVDHRRHANLGLVTRFVVWPPGVHRDGYPLNTDGVPCFSGFTVIVRVVEYVRLLAHNYRIRGPGRGREQAETSIPHLYEIYSGGRF